jgi:uncharacterized membrane protein
MTSKLSSVSPSTSPVPKISFRANIWILVPFGALALGIVSNNLLILDYLHVMCAILWTGADIFMAFLLGPVLKRAAFSSRRDIASWLMPKLIFYMPTMSSVTIVAGYFLGSRMGLIQFAPPIGYYIAIVGILVAILVIQGFGMLLRSNVKVFHEMRKSEPDQTLIESLLKSEGKLFASQSITQLILIFVMANFATGFPLSF